MAYTSLRSGFSEPAQTENLWKGHLEMATDDIRWVDFASVRLNKSDRFKKSMVCDQDFSLASIRNGIFPNLLKLRIFGNCIWKWPPVTSGGWFLHLSGSKNQTICDRDSFEPAEAANLWKQHSEMATDDIQWVFFASVFKKSRNCDRCFSLASIRRMRMGRHSF